MNKDSSTTALHLELSEVDRKSIDEHAVVAGNELW